MGEMLCRVVLAAVAVSYLICVLFLSGIQKEDLDVSLLRKLQRYDGNLTEWNDKKLTQECLNNTENHSKEKDASLISVDIDALGNVDARQMERLITALESELNIVFQKLKDKNHLPDKYNSIGIKINITSKENSSAETTTQKHATTSGILYDTNEDQLEFWENFMQRHKHKTNDKPSFNNETKKEYTESSADTEEKSTTLRNKHEDIFKNVITKFLLNKNVSVNVRTLQNSIEQIISTTEVPKSSNSNLELQLLSNIAAVDRLKQNLLNLKNKINAEATQFQIINKTIETASDDISIELGSKTATNKDNITNHRQLHHLFRFRETNNTYNEPRRILTGFQSGQNNVDIFKYNNNRPLNPQPFSSRELNDRFVQWKPNKLQENLLVPIVDKSSKENNPQFFNEPYYKQKTNSFEIVKNYQPEELSDIQTTREGLGVGQYNIFSPINPIRYNNVEQVPSQLVKFVDDEDDFKKEYPQYIIKPHITEKMPTYTRFPQINPIDKIERDSKNATFPEVFDYQIDRTKITDKTINYKTLNNNKIVPIFNDNIKQTESNLQIPDIIENSNIQPKIATLGLPISKDIGQMFSHDAINLIAENLKKFMLRDLNKDLIKTSLAAEEKTLRISPKDSNTNSFITTTLVSTSSTAVLTTSTPTTTTTNMSTAVPYTTSNTTATKTTSSSTTTTTTTTSMPSTTTPSPTPSTVKTTITTTTPKTITSKITPTTTITTSTTPSITTKVTSTSIATNASEDNIGTTEEPRKQKMQAINKAIQKFIELFEQFKPTTVKPKNNENMENKSSSRHNDKPSRLSYNFMIPTSLPPTQSNIFPVPSTTFTTQTPPRLVPQMLAQVGIPFLPQMSFPMLSQMAPQILPQIDPSMAFHMRLPPLQQIGQPIVSQLNPPVAHFNPQMNSPFNIMMGSYGAPQIPPIPTNAQPINSLNFLIPQQHIAKVPPSSQAVMIQTNSNEIRPLTIPLMTPHVMNIVLKRKPTWNKDNKTKMNNTVRNVSRSAEKSKYRDERDNDTKMTVLPIKLEDTKRDQKQKTNMTDQEKELMFYKNKYIEFMSKMNNSVKEKDKETQPLIPNYRQKLYYKKRIEDRFRNRGSSVETKYDNNTTNNAPKEPSIKLAKSDYSPITNMQSSKYRIPETGTDNIKEETVKNNVRKLPEISNNKNDGQDQEKILDDIIKNRGRYQANFYLSAIPSINKHSIFPINTYYDSEGLYDSIDKQYNKYINKHRVTKTRNPPIYHSGDDERHYYNGRLRGTVSKNIDKKISDLKAWDEIDSKTRTEQRSGFKEREYGQRSKYHGYTHKEHAYNENSDAGKDYVRPYKDFIRQTRLKQKFKDLEPSDQRYNDNYRYRYKYRHDPVEVISALTSDDNKQTMSTDVDAEDQTRYITQSETSDVEGKHRTSEDEPSYSDSEAKRFPKLEGFHTKLERSDSWPDTTKNEIHKRHQKPIDEAHKHDDTNFKNFLKTQDKVNRMLEKILATKVEEVHSVETI